ncbi:MAG: hypothetical protein ACREP9_21295, partial [Candidatus Dormibacteraceae bacterium]
MAGFAVQAAKFLLRWVGVRSVGGPRRPAAGRPSWPGWRGLGGIALLLLLPLLIVVPSTVVERALQGVKIKPELGIALDAYQASQSCPFTPGNSLTGMLVLIGQAFLATGAESAAGANGESHFGVYRNPLVGLPGYVDPLQNTASLRLDPALLRPGGEVYEELGLRQTIALSEWTTLAPVEGEHGLGFLLLTPSQWQAWSPEPGLDPYRPKDA